MDASKKTNIKLSVAVGVAIVLIMTYTAVIGILIYGFGADNPLTRKTSDLIPFPCAIVDGDFITLSELNEKTAAVRRFYENQDFSSVGMRVDFSTPDGKKRLKIKEKDVLDKMIEDSIIENQANRNGIKITSEMVSQEVRRTMVEYGSEDQVRENIDRLYGWTIADFEKNAVKPDLYKEQLFDNLKSTDASYKEAKRKIEEASSELGRRGNFGELAKKYSEGESAQNEGDLGWFEESQMLPEIAQKAFSLEKGQVSELIESPLGYHIIKVEDKKTESGVEKVHIRQIFVRTKTMADWLDQYKKKVKIYIPLKGYQWGRETNLTEFSSPEMRDFEKTLPQNDSGMF